MADVNLTINGEDKSSPAFKSVDQSIGKTSNSFSDLSGAAELSGKAIADNMDVARDSIDGVSQSGNGLKAFLLGIGAAIADLGRRIFEGIAPELASAENEVKQVGTSIGEHIKSWAEQSVATAAAFRFFGSEVAMAVGIAFNAIAALTIAYKGLSFAVGLVTGSSYKSENIDALVATNNEVKSLQKQLQLTAVDANALNDALRRTGADKSDFVSVYQSVESAIRSNGDELDRLGIKYQNADGSMMATQQIVQNVKNKLDEYTAGWDRNQAAAAIGMGTYDQINNYLKTNQQEFQKSKERIDEYNLGIGTETQNAVDNYQKAMLEFNNEEKLMSEGFKRAIADNIMPVLTDFAMFFKDGFPSIVGVFRYTMATLTSLLWGLKTSVDIVVDTIKLGFGGVTDILIGVAKASALALTGDFSGATDALVSGWENAKNRAAKAGAEMVTDAQHNAQAMKLAWGFDNRQAGNGNRPVKGGKPWEPGETEDAEDLAAYQSTLNAYNDAYARYSKAFEENRAALTKQGNERIAELNQIDFDKGLVDLQTYLDKKHKLSEEVIQADIDSKKKELQEAQKAFVEADKTDKVDGGDIGTQTARMNALAKVTEAQGALNKVTGDYALLQIKNGEETRKMAEAATAAYKNMQIAALESAGDFEAAEALKQEVYRKSAEYLKLEADALAGNEEAWKAMMAVEKQEAIDFITATNRKNEVQRQYADDIAKMQDEIDALNGKDASRISIEAKIRDGLSTEAQLRDKLNLAIAQGNSLEITGLTEKIRLQTLLNQRLQTDLALQQRKAELLGQIVGYDGNRPIYADDYQREQNQTRYIPNDELTGSGSNSFTMDQWGNHPGSPYYVGNGYSTGLPPMGSNVNSNQAPNNAAVSATSVSIAALHVNVPAGTTDEQARQVAVKVNQLLTQRIRKVA